MAKLSFSPDATVISRRILLTGAVASISALVLAACGGTEAGPVPTVTRVPAEGAPPTPTPAPPATPGASPAATPVGDEATPAPSAEAATPASDGGAATVGPLIAIDIGWKLGDLSTMTGDAITLTVAPGTTFEMISEGAAEHNFVVDEFALEVPVAPGETTTVTIPADAAPGEYRFYCSVPGHEAAGMVGTLVVQAGDAAAAPAGGETTEPAPPPADTAGGGEAVGPLIAIDIGWELGDLSTLAGDAVNLTVAPGTTFEMISEGAAEHDFTVDALAVHVPVAPGETVEVTIPADAAPSEYEYYCSVPGHKAAGMVGTLVVQ